MRWSWRLFQVGGIGVHVHLTFVLLPLWVIFASYAQRGRVADAALAFAFIVVLFAVVVLHELAHALTAKRFGIATRDITLLPIGGVARLERMPENPRQELLVALAGPAVNVVLAGVMFAAISFGTQFSGFAESGLSRSGFLDALMWINVALAVFNLLPAFPMDGGRVLRALLAMRLNYVMATNVAAGLGQVIAVLFAFLGLASIFFDHFGPLSNPFLLLIGLFVWVGAAQEAGVVRMKSALGGVPVTSVMMTDFRCLSPEESLAQAAEQMLAGGQHDFPVVQQGRLVGLLTRKLLLDGLTQFGGNAVVGQVMLQPPSTIDVEATAEAAVLRLRTGPEAVLLATRGNQVLGIISGENVSEYLRLKGATHEPQEQEGRRRAA